MNENDCMPMEPELRMLRSVAVSALAEALASGHAHATFHGFELNARCLGARHRHKASMELTVRHHGRLLERATGSIQVV